MSSLQILSLNRKLEKSLEKFGDSIVTAGLFLAPHNRSGHNVCPNAGFCSAVCNLWFSGRTVTGNVRDAMIRRTKLYFDNPAEFFDVVHDDIAKLRRVAVREGKQLYLRMNGSSDLDFSRWAIEFPDVQFYDYTKRPEFIERKLAGNWPLNYWLCYSFNEHADPALCDRYLALGGTVSVVFDTEYCPQHDRIGKLPKRFTFPGSVRRWRVVDGDQHDLRHPQFDGTGVVVGLRFKGSRRLMETAIDRGFVVRTK